MALFPASVRNSRLYLRFGPSAIRSRLRSTQSVFSEIYRKNLWGGPSGSFYSGPGSRGAIAEAYVALITRFIESHNVRSVVDLGCGDMFIGQQIAQICDRYTGIDVVEVLIAAHRRKFGSDKIAFECLDIARDPLPHADLCLVRQVFQHLSNAQIAASLDKMRRNFSHIIVTEHFPDPDAFWRANVDKAAAASTRVPLGSAVMLDQPPFNICIKELLTCSADSGNDGDEDIHSRGLIRSFLVLPNRISLP